MAGYAVVGQETLAAGSTILYTVNGSTARRLKVHHVIAGASGTPDDQAAQVDVRRVTAEATTPGGTAVTPFPLDEDDPVALSNAVEAPTSEPTYATGSGLELGLNQRATFQWIATPGKELVASATTDHGFGAICVAVTTGWAAHVTMHYTE